MTEPVWLTNDALEGNPKIKVERRSVPHYTAWGWYETDPEPELTAADLEAQPEPEPEAPEEAPEPEAEPEAEPGDQPEESE